MKKALILLMMASFMICSAISGCTKGMDSEAQRKESETLPNPTAEAIKGHVQAPIKKARSAQNLGDDRLDAMDRAVKSQN